MTEKRVGWAIATTGLFLIGTLTLIPHPELAQRVAETSIFCLVCGELGGVDILLNVVLLIPFGAGLQLVGLRRIAAVGLIVLTTLAVETLQYYVIAGRDSSLSDALTNLLGGMLGLALGATWRRWIFPRPHHSRRLARAGILVWLAVLVLTSWLLRLSLPRTGYWGQWAPELGHLERFEGSVLSAHLEGEPLPPFRHNKSARLREQMLTDSVRLEASATLGGRTPDLAPIVSVFDDQQREILLMGQDESDLVFRIRMRAADLRLRNPAIRVPKALPDSPGERIGLVGSFDGQRLLAAAEIGGVCIVGTEALSPNQGWSLLLPVDYAFGPEARVLTALWIAGLLLPIGYWAGRGEKARAMASLLAGGVLSGLALVPALFALLRVHWSEWLAAAVGVVLGWRLGVGSRESGPESGELRNG